MKITKVITTALIAAVCISACGANEPSKETIPQNDVQNDAQNNILNEQEETEGSTSEQEVCVANPWKDCSQKEANAACPRLFKAPDGAQDIHWSIMEDAKDEDKNLGELVQLDFALDNLDFCARALYGADENAQIHGLYYDWTQENDVALADWGDGNMQGKYYRGNDDQGCVDLITWYDVETGISYSLSVSAEDLDGFDLQAVAEQMYNVENEPNTGNSENPQKTDESADSSNEAVTDENTLNKKADAKDIIDIKDYADVWTSDYGGDLEQQLAEKLGSKVEVSKMGDSNVICDGAIEFYGSANNSGFFVWQSKPVDNFFIYGISIGMNEEEAISILKQQGMEPYAGDQRLLYSADFDRYYIELSPEDGKIAKLTYVRCTGERE